MTKPLRTCLDCGEVFDGDGPRCPKHSTEFERTRGSATARGYDSKWRTLVKEAIRLHLERFGAVCPGFKVPPHTATKASLTGDHRIPLSMGGKNEVSNIDVMCRSCNSRKGGRNRDGGSSSAAEAAPPAAPKKKSFLIYKYD